MVPFSISILVYRSVATTKPWHYDWWWREFRLTNQGEGCIIKHWHKLTNLNLGGGFKYFLFSPRSLGKWWNLTCAYFFQMGWFNHQLGTINRLDVHCQPSLAGFLNPSAIAIPEALPGFILAKFDTQRSWIWSWIMHKDFTYEASRWWVSSIFFGKCSSRTLGKLDPIWRAHFFFQMGWLKPPTRVDWWFIFFDGTKKHPKGQLLPDEYSERGGKLPRIGEALGFRRNDSVDE